MKLISLLEVRAFRRLVPPEALRAVPAFRTAIERLNAAYDAGSFTTYEKLGELPDTFSPQSIKVYAMAIDFYTQRGFRGQGSMGTMAGTPTIVYRIPMGGFDTIYHEIVHAYDPKVRLGLSKSVQIPTLGQSMVTPHEIDATVAGRVDDINFRLDSLPTAEQRRLRQELATWLRMQKDDAALDLENLPDLLRGWQLGYLIDKPELRRRVLSILYQELIAPHA